MPTWDVLFHPAFLREFEDLESPVRVEIVAIADLLGRVGPHLRRPHSDTLSGSKYANMKEFRFDADGCVWRAAYAFDPLRRAIILDAGDKSGGSQRQFYRRLLEKADERFGEHLRSIRK